MKKKHENLMKPNVCLRRGDGDVLTTADGGYFMLVLMIGFELAAERNTFLVQNLQYYVPLAHLGFRISFPATASLDQ